MKKDNSKQATQSFVRYVSSETPWGQAQSAEEIGPGIIRYSTASHGGYFLSQEANAKVSPILRNATFCGQGKKGWYEEDVDSAIVVFTFKEYFDKEHYGAAIETLVQFHSNAWERLRKKSAKK